MNQLSLAAVMDYTGLFQWVVVTLAVTTQATAQRYYDNNNNQQEHVSC